MILDAKVKMQKYIKSCMSNNRGYKKQLSRYHIQVENAI